MSVRGTIKRQYLIIQKIRNGHYPSFREINNYLQNAGFELSQRSIQKDLESIRFEFGIDIVYDRAKNGYVIDNLKDQELNNFLQFIELANNAGIIIDTLKQGKEANKFLSFDSNDNFKGIELMPVLIEAIRTSRVVSFIHKNYLKDTNKLYEIEPYHIKENNNRWYLIGRANNLNETRTFGLDRINELQILEKKFTIPASFDIEKMFENIYGITYINTTPINIELSFVPFLAKYLKSLPIHLSQEILIDNEEEFRISLFLIINNDIIRLLLSYGNNVKVLEPKSLIVEITAILTTAINQY